MRGHYSARSIIAGSIRTARSTAGTTAHAAAASKTIIGIAIIEIAVPLTPYSNDCTNRTDPIAAANPTTAPTSTVKNIRAETMRARYPRYA
jgi:hypothetical protein